MKGNNVLVLLKTQCILLLSSLYNTGVTQGSLTPTGRNRIKNPDSLMEKKTKKHNIFLSPEETKPCIYFKIVTISYPISSW